MSNNKKLPYIIGSAVVLLLVVFLFAGSKSKKQSTSLANNTIPATSSANNTLTSQDPQDIVPGLYENMIQNNAVKDGLVISAITVENNTDKTGKTINDHLELSLKNNSGSDMTGFEVYYTITDTVTNKKEGYFKKLDGFVLKSGQSESINFDNQSGTGHFGANKNSIYYTSNNKMHFEVMVSATGYKVQTVQADKAAGGAETKD